jgi:hypothetical protein
VKPPSPFLFCPGELCRATFPIQEVIFLQGQGYQKMCGGDRLVAAQTILQIDAEIAEKEPFGWKRDSAPGFESRAAGSNPAGRTNDF